MTHDLHRFQNRADAVLSLLAGSKSLSEVAAEHGLTEQELAEARDGYLAITTAQLRRVASTQAHSAKRRSRTARLAAISGALLLLGGGVALSQATWPITLKTFTPGTPAVADDVNANFSALKAGVTYVNDQTEAKIGAFSNPNVVAKVGLLMGQLGLFYDVNILGGDGSAGFPYRAAMRGDRAANTLSINGDNAYGTGTIIGSALAVNGAVTINGNATVNGHLDRAGDRIVVSLPYNTGANTGNGMTNGIIAIDQTKFDRICGDLSGCSVTIVERDYGALVNDVTVSIGPVHLEYNTVNGNYRIASNAFRSPDADNVSLQPGKDGDGVVGEALGFYNCRLTDSNNVLGNNIPSDPATRQMYFWSFNGTTGHTPNCVLIIDD